VLKTLSLLSLSLTVSSCVTLPNTKACSVAGTLLGGAICAETLTGVKSEMTFDEYMEFLEPQEAPTPRAGAICQSAEDWGKQKTALEQACRELGSNCKKETRQALEKLLSE